MIKSELDKLKYPIGDFETPSSVSQEEIQGFINTIKSFPTDIKKLTSELSKEQLAWIYRPESWSVAQVVNHCADSHMNALIRFKLTLTENEPMIKPYREGEWAKLRDGQNLDLTSSLSILKGVHDRWSVILENMKTDDFNRAYMHPEDNKLYSLKNAAALYDWHCRHHLRHIKQALELRGKYN